MTLPSRKKHQITRPNTTLETTKRGFVGEFASNLLTFDLPFKAVLASAFVASMSFSTLIAQESPLDRLQKRSADARWREASSEWLPQEAETVSEPMPVEKRMLLKEESTGSSSEKPKTQTKKIDETVTNRESFSLFEPFPNRVITKQDHQNGTAHPKRVNLSKPFPVAATPATKTKEVVDHSNAVLSVGNLLPPEVEESAEKSAQEFKKPVAVALVNQVPPAPKLESGMPKLRSISDIKPYHDYVPVKKSTIGNQVVKPLNDNGPEFLKLPASGTLESDSPPTYYHWMASNVTHNPLYFEDVSLERYGHSYPLQPLVSISKFGLQVVGLPYQMALNPVDCEEYPLGYYRPGDCAPFLRYRIPFNKTAALTSVGAYTGLIFLIP